MDDPTNQLEDTDQENTVSKRHKRTHFQCDQEVVDNSADNISDDPVVRERTILRFVLSKKTIIIQYSFFFVATIHYILCHFHSLHRDSETFILGRDSHLHPLIMQTPKYTRFALARQPGKNACTYFSRNLRKAQRPKAHDIGDNG